MVPESLWAQWTLDVPPECRSCRLCPESVSDPLHRIVAVSRANCHQIETHSTVVQFGSAGEELPCCQDDSPDLSLTYGFHRTANRAGPAQSHLDDNDHPMIFHDEIEFAHTAGVVTGDKRQASGSEKGFGQSFTCTAAAAAQEPSRGSGTLRIWPLTTRAHSSSRDTLPFSTSSRFPVRPAMPDTASLRKLLNKGTSV